MMEILPGSVALMSASHGTRNTPNRSRLVNLTANIGVDLDPRHPREAEETARILTAHILAGVRLDEPAS